MQKNNYIALASAIGKLTTLTDSAKPVEESVLGAIIQRPALMEGLENFGPHLFPNHPEVSALVIAHIQAKGTSGVQVMASTCKSAGVAEVHDIHRICSLADFDFFDAQVERLQHIWTAQVEAEVRANALSAIASGMPLDEVCANEEQERRAISGIKDARVERDKRYMQYLADIEESMNGNKPAAPTWPWNSINRRIGQLQPGRFIVVGARPGMGKTTLTMQAAQYVALQAPTLFISLEMPEQQLLGKIIQARIGVERSRLESGQITLTVFKEVVDQVTNLYELPLFFDDTAYDIANVVHSIRRHARQQGVKVVIIDYLQLIGNRDYRGSNSNDLIGGISKALKRVAMAENVCIIALSQLSRAVETRGGAKRPILSDLRESGSIEQDADIVAFLYRPGYYAIKEDEEGNSTEGVTEVIVAKNRHYSAGLGITNLYHNAETDTLHEERPNYAKEANPISPIYNPIVPAVTISRIADDEDIPF